MVVQVKDKAELQRHLSQAGSKLVVIDFFATWCGPCKMIAPVLEKMSEEMKDHVVFLKVDVDESEDLAAEYSVQAMPTFVLLKNGSKVDSFSGANEAKLKELINKHK